MGEFAVTAAGHSFVGRINPQRIQSSPAQKTNDQGATMLTPYQTKNVLKTLYKTTEPQRNSGNVVQMLKPRGNVNSADIIVVFK